MKKWCFLLLACLLLGGLALAEDDGEWSDELWGVWMDAYSDAVYEPFENLADVEEPFWWFLHDGTVITADARGTWKADAGVCTVEIDGEKTEFDIYMDVYLHPMDEDAGWYLAEAMYGALCGDCEYWDTASIPAMVHPGIQVAVSLNTDATAADHYFGSPLNEFGSLIYPGGLTLLRQENALGAKMITGLRIGEGSGFTFMDSAPGGPVSEQLAAVLEDGKAWLAYDWENWEWTFCSQAEYQASDNGWHSAALTVETEGDVITQITLLLKVQE